MTGSGTRTPVVPKVPDPILNGSGHRTLGSVPLRFGVLYPYWVLYPDRRFRTQY